MAVRISDSGILAVERTTRDNDKRLWSTSSGAARQEREQKVTMASGDGRRMSGSREDEGGAGGESESLE